MPDLVHTLQGQDPGFLGIVAQFWGVDLDTSSGELTVERLAERMLDQETFLEILETLPSEAKATLHELARGGGRLAWGAFVRRYGMVREMGPGRRDREKPYRKPVSASEILWYRALLARAFFDTPGGPQEFAYIPTDLLSLLPVSQGTAGQPFGRPATPAERSYIQPATDCLLDDACTLLAALRLSLSMDDIPLSAYPSPYPLSPPPLKSLLASAGLLDPQDLPLPAPTRAHLEAPRGDALSQLARAWRDSPTFNELALIPQLILEGDWSTDPQRSRQAILGFLAGLPANSWWSLSGLISDIHQAQPDFQRTSGDYDSWFIRHSLTGDYLRGFAKWDQVDGELIRFTICGPLHWLGIVDLASPEPGEHATAFRFSNWGLSLLRGIAPPGLPNEDDKIYARSDGRLRLSRRVPRSVRYQIARFSNWDGMKDDFYRYQVTPASLERARRQDLQIAHLLSLLRRHVSALPPVLITALERWEAHGTQARLERLLVLRVATPEVLQELRSSRAARFLGDPLSPTAIIVKSGAAGKVLAALAEMGYLGLMDDLIE